MYTPTTQRGLAANGLAWLALIFVVVGLIGAVSFGVRWVTAGPKGQLQAREQIQSGANRIQKYDHFFNLCASVQTAEAALDQSMSELATATADDKERLRTNITGQFINRADAVNQYNADARKSYTGGQFRSSDLPYQLPTTYTRGATTSCVA